jgi:hypothetical protein
MEESHLKEIRKKFPEDNIGLVDVYSPNARERKLYLKDIIVNLNFESSIINLISFHCCS